MVSCVKPPLGGVRPSRYIETVALSRSPQDYSPEASCPHFGPSTRAVSSLSTSTLEQDHYSKATALILESSPSVFNFAVSDRTPSPQALHSIGPEQLLQAPSQSLPRPPRARRRCQQWPGHIPQTEKTMCSCTRHAFAQMVQCCRNTLGQLTRLGRVIATLLPLG